LFSAAAYREPDHAHDDQYDAHACGNQAQDEPDGKRGVDGVAASIEVQGGEKACAAAPSEEETAK
jgi:hypothetical protein